MTRTAQEKESRSLRLYARLLELYPPAFLQRHRAEMLQNFADLEDAATSKAALSLRQSGGENTRPQNKNYSGRENTPGASGCTTGFCQTGGWGAEGALPHLAMRWPHGSPGRSRYRRVSRAGSKRSVTSSFS
jgi:hypothetical protein